MIKLLNIKKIISKDEQEKIKLNEIKSPSLEEFVPLTNEVLNYYINEFTKLLYNDKISEDNLDKYSLDHKDNKWKKQYEYDKKIK